MSIFKLSSVFGAWFARREVFYTRLDKNELKNMENAVRNDLFRHLLIYFRNPKDAAGRTLVSPKTCCWIDLKRIKPLKTKQYTAFSRSTYRVYGVLQFSPTRFANF